MCFDVAALTLAYWGCPAAMGNRAWTTRHYSMSCSNSLLTGSNALIKKQGKMAALKAPLPLKIGSCPLLWHCPILIANMDARKSENASFFFLLKRSITSKLQPQIYQRLCIPLCSVFKIYVSHRLQ